MRCRECENLMIIRVYGSLEALPENDLKDHLKQCPECHRKYLSIQDHSGILAVRDPESEPDWDRSWQTISEKALKKSKIRRSLLPLPKPVLAAISLVVVFSLGFLVGKRFFFKPTGTQSPSILADLQPDSPLQSYAEALEPLLIGFLNRTGSSHPSEARELQNIQSLLVQDMLIQTRLLRQLVTVEGDPHLQELLDDLELVLRTMANLRPDDQESLQQLQSVIREKEIKIKLRTLVSSQSVL